MSNYPDFTTEGYRVVSELGRNREGGRITWLATELESDRQVALKQFRFAQADSTWSAYKAYEQEIEVLRGLDRSGIPRYLTSFENPDGFCLVQEYKNAPSLATNRSFQPEEIKEIAIKALEILVYLQNRIPPIIHRDIKPENILVDDRLNVYLIDFGFARIGSQEVSGSSVFKGTPGFIPPEQMRQPTTASDLYGLGATLICLLTGIKSTEIQNLTDDDDPYLIEFKHLLPKLSLRFIEWLEKMVHPKQKQRFPDAETALEALRPLYLHRVPEVKLSATNLEFQATKLGEKLAKNISISNTIPETVLEGKWEVLAHPSDPPHQPASHPWLKFSPAKFASNQVECQIRIDTSNLMADRVYQRQICLHSNSSPATKTLSVKVQTAPIPLATRNPPYGFVILLLLATLLVSGVTAGVLSRFGLWAAAATLTGFGVVLAGVAHSRLQPKSLGWLKEGTMVVAGAAVGAIPLTAIGAGFVAGIWWAVLIVAAVIVVAVMSFEGEASEIDENTLKGATGIVVAIVAAIGYGFVAVGEAVMGYSPNFWVFLGACFASSIVSLFVFWVNGFKNRFSIGLVIPLWSMNIALAVAMTRPETFDRLRELKTWAASTIGIVNQESIVALTVWGILPAIISCLAIMAAMMIGWVTTMANLVTSSTVNGLIDRGFKALFAILLVLLTLELGVALGIGLTVGLLDSSVLLSLAASGLPLVAMLMYSPLKRAQLIAKYRQGEQSLIKP